MFFVASTTILVAQNDVNTESNPYFYLGVIGGGTFIKNFTTLPIISGSTDCGEFGNGESQGYQFGITGDYPILPFLLASGRIYYSHRPAALQLIRADGWNAFDPSTSTYIPYIRQHDYTASLTYLALDLGVRILPLQPLDLDIPLFFRISADAGNAVFGATYEQREEIVQPSLGLLVDPQGNWVKSRLIGSGELTDAATAYGVSGSVGVDISLTGKLSLSPEIGYRKGINSLLRTQSWQTENWFGLINLRYALADPTAETSLPAERHPEVPVIAKKQTPAYSLRSISSEPINVQETIVTETYPLLPYIFFDSSSSKIRSRYSPEVNKKTFTEGELPKQTLIIYYNLLNIVAKRMLQNPSSKIILTGTTDGREDASPAARKKIAEERAKDVAYYLTNEWGIAADRMTIATTDIPQLASTFRVSEGLEENRRVEIFSSDPQILAPVVHSKFVEYAPLNATQVIGVQQQRDVQANHWQADITRKNSATPIATSYGENKPPEQVRITIDTAAMVSLGRTIEPSDSLRAVLNVTRVDGTAEIAECMIPILKTQNKYEISRLSLIVFDYDRSLINDDNRTMMQEFINEAVTPLSKIYITGSTDRLGEMDYNISLSQLRADAAKNAMLDIDKTLNVEYARGIGASRLPYDNSLPEGRYYCRTVSIIVKTPTGATSLREKKPIPAKGDTVPNTPKNSKNKQLQKP